MPQNGRILAWTSTLEGGWGQRGSNQRVNFWTILKGKAGYIAGYSVGLKEA